MEEIIQDPQAVVGEAEVESRSEKVRRQINKLIKAVNTNTFDLGELLHEVKTKNFFNEWGFPTYAQYAKSLSIKYSRAFYLVKIVEVMRKVGLGRGEYEGAGIVKLRTICELDPEAEYKGTPVSMLIRELTLKAESMSPEEVRAEVDRIQGKTEDDSMVWLNLHVKKIARENVMKPALALAKKHIGSVGQDEEGTAIDPSDGAAAEMIFANFLADPNYNSESKPKTVAQQLLDLLNTFSVPDGTTVEELKEVLKSQLAPKETPQTETPAEEEPTTE